MKRLRSRLDDHHDWLRPGRAGARLPLTARRYVDEFHDWPMVYAGRDGKLHILAPHHEPHINLGVGLVGLALLGLGGAGIWLWTAVHPLAIVAPIAAAVPLLLLLLRLSERNLEIIVEPDGLVVRRDPGGGEHLLLKNYELPHAVFAGPHGLGKREAAMQGRTARSGNAGQTWASMVGDQTRQGQSGPTLPSMPAAAPRYAEATEVVLQSGPRLATLRLVAEFRADRDGRAVKLKAAIEFVIEQARKEKAQRAASDISFV